MENLNTLIFASISPVLLTIGGIISWVIKSKREEYLNQEAKSRNFKIEIYEKMLDPFIATFTKTISEKERKKEIDKIKTLEYKKTIFNLTTFGSDEVIRTFNNIMQTFYEENLNKDDENKMSRENTVRLLSLLSELLLTIRKDVYSNKTSLKRSETLEFMITDIKNYKEQIDNYRL